MRAALLLAIAACSDPDPLTLTATTVDFLGGAGVAPTSATVETVQPTPAARVDGAITVGGIPGEALVDLVITAEAYLPTRSIVAFEAASITTALPLVSTATLAQWAADFGFTPMPGRGIALVQIAAAPDTVTLFGEAIGPYPIGADTLAYFDVAPGLPLLVGTDAVIDAQIPITADTVTVIALAPPAPDEPLPSPISFAADVLPALAERCGRCHAWTAANLAPHVTIAAPTSSAALALPSRGPDRAHPNVVFTGPGDRTYRLLQRWIALGAGDN